MMCLILTIFQKSQNTSIELSMRLADLRVVRQIEKYLYDFPAIISAVGGSMGLFLGFSFYAMGKNLIDRLLIL